MSPHSRPQPYRYLTLTVEPPLADELALRKALQDALATTFGLVYAGAPIDVLALSPVTLVRVASGCVRPRYAVRGDRTDVMCGLNFYWAGDGGFCTVLACVLLVDGCVASAWVTWSALLGHG
jgi:hypothetical protein